MQCGEVAFRRNSHNTVIITQSRDLKSKSRKQMGDVKNDEGATKVT
jgi:hypothetical protein